MQLGVGEQIERIENQNLNFKKQRTKNDSQIQ